MTSQPTEQSAPMELQTAELSSSTIQAAESPAQSLRSTTLELSTSGQSVIEPSLTPAGPPPSNSVAFYCNACDYRGLTHFQTMFHVTMCHPPICLNCELQFRSWDALYHHRQHCAYRTYQVVPQRPQPTPATTTKKKTYRFKCNLCARKFDQFKSLQYHVNRCPRRRRFNSWILKNSAN